MKNIFISVLACAALLLVSCQRENLEPAAQGQTVTYTVQVPTAISTKALGDDISGVTLLKYEVYREADIEDIAKEPIYSGTEQIDAEGKATFVLEFIKDQDFRVLFWAQDPDADMYATDDLRNVTLSTTLVANNAEAAVFAGSDKVEKGVSITKGNVSLVRPIAQLNIATSNESRTVGNVTVGIKESGVTVKGLSTTYNVATGETGTDETDFVYGVADAPSDAFSATHTYVAMSYVGFAPAAGTTVDVDFTIGTTEGEIEHSVSNVPVKPNYRTNIIGNLITAESDYNITLNMDWATEVKEVVVVKVNDAAGLQEAVNNIPEGSEGNIILDGDIDLSALAGMISVKSGAPAYGLLIPAGKALVLDLNGCKLSQTVQQTAQYSMILNHGTLTIDDSKGNGKISYTDSGNGGEYISDAIYNNGVLVINGGTIENLSSATVASNGYPHAVDTYSGSRNTSVTINGGTICCAEYSAVRMFCVSATYTADLVINGGIIKGAIDMQNGTKLAAVGTLTINGGTFETTKNANNIRFANWNNGATEYGLTATIKGGEFNGGITTAYVPEAANWNKGIITGGTFVVDPTDFLADGYYTEQADGNYVVYKAVAAIGETKYKSLEEAIAAAEAEATITVLCDAEMAGNATIAAGKTVVIDLNGCTISAVDNTEKSYQIIQNTGNLTIKNSAENTAKMTVKATINSGWNRYSAVIANTVGGTLTVEENVLLEHLGGTDMAYGIDNLTNGKGTYAVTTIDGATVKSPYRAVRQFLNGIEATNELYVKAGSELRGDNKSIFFQDPSKNANTGKLVVEEGARLYGDVYLFVTAGSTEWPVEVSIAASTLADASEVLSGNVPSGYDVINDNGTWKVVKYPSFNELVEKVITGNGTYEGNGETYMIIPASGDARTTDDRTVPNRLQKYGNPDVYYAQYQRFADLTDINISNVTITFVPAAITVQDAWNTAGATTTSENINGEIQFMNTGNVTLTNCVFNTVSVSPINALELTVTGCEFNDLMAYAIKDVKANTVINNNEFNNCNGGFWFNAAPKKITAKENIFSVERRGAIQFSASGDYTDTSIEISGNKVEGALLWQLNTTLSYEQYKAIIDNNTYTEAYVDGSVIPAEK